ncbi:MAG: hypothetical protein EBQ57_03980 [Actinobacteria bacterium]|nr:hypothetical protein [Actinomycetota bacterium]
MLPMACSNWSAEMSASDSECVACTSVLRSAAGTNLKVVYGSVPFSWLMINCLRPLSTVVQTSTVNETTMLSLKRS